MLSARTRVPSRYVSGGSDLHRDTVGNADPNRHTAAVHRHVDSDPNAYAAVHRDGYGLAYAYEVRYRRDRYAYGVDDAEVFRHQDRDGYIPPDRQHHY